MPPEKMSRRAIVRLTLFVLLVMALVCLPFALIGESYVLPLLESQEQRAVWLTVIAIVLLSADAIAPVPSVLVILFLAMKAGPMAGAIGGAVGLSSGVVFAWWFGRAAVGRIAPRFLPDGELARLRSGLERRLWFTLACWRSVPVMAETSVMIAGASGVPLRRVFAATLLPNCAIAVIYAYAADGSLTTFVLAFAATMVVSLVGWRRSAR